MILSGRDPDPAELRKLHEAVIAGDDPTAPARMAEVLLPALLQRFAAARFKEPHTVDSLVGLSIARYLADPSRYLPERGPLLAYLWQDVKGDLRNEWEKSSRLRQHESPDSDLIELATSDRNLTVEEEVLDAMDPFDVPSAVLERARDQLSRFSSQDLQLIALLGSGIRDTAPYAEVLGIAHLPRGIQAKEVNRHKDRLKKRLGVIRDQLSQPQ
jgi:hypothetical protein